MKAFLTVVGILLLAGTAYAVNDLSGVKVYGFRYKLIVEIDTPEGVKTGSSVREVNIRLEPRPLQPPKNYYPKIKVKGEAVVVDLGERGTVFARLQSGAYMEVTQTIKGPDIYIKTPESAEFYSSLKHGIKADMESKNYPSMYTFTDLNDPLSVKLVKGGRFSVEAQKHLMEDNFEELFGEGVSLKSVSLEITDEPVTWGIEKRLPWLKGLKSNIDGSSSTSSRRLSNILHAGNFKLGKTK